MPTSAQPTRSEPSDRPCLGPHLQRQAKAEADTVPDSEAQKKNKKTKTKNNVLEWVPNRGAELQHSSTVYDLAA
jgi:hypothetical protein